MALMRARHEVFGVADVADTDFYRDNGWVEVDPSTPTRVEEERAAEAEAYLKATSYDPADHKAEEVVEYVATVPEDEKARVVEAEKSGKARKSVLEATAE